MFHFHDYLREGNILGTSHILMPKRGHILKKETNYLGTSERRALDLNNSFCGVLLLACVEGLTGEPTWRLGCLMFAMRHPHIPTQQALWHLQSPFQPIMGCDVLREIAPASPTLFPLIELAIVDRTPSD